jgi:hypothetical protein
LFYDGRRSNLRRRRRRRSNFNAGWQLGGFWNSGRRIHGDKLVQSSTRLRMRSFQVRIPRDLWWFFSVGNLRRNTRSGQLGFC